jgi:hypothetical protein
MTTFEAALLWRSLGVSTIPVEPGAKQPTIPWKRWQSELPSVSQLADWFWQTDHNIAVITGGDPGLVVLDFDTSHAFARWARDNRDVADSTRIESTPNGYHAYLFATETVQSVQSQQVDRIEIKAGGQCCNVAPSRCNGRQYRVIQDAPVLRVQTLEEALLRLSMATALSRERRVQPDRDDDAPAFSFTEHTAGASPPSWGLVDQIKSKLPILDLLLRYTDPKPSSRDGTWWLMRCPNPKHHDEHASFWANTKNGLASCYVPWCRETQPGGRQMDVIGLYAWIHGCSNGEAIKQLAEGLQTEVANG